MVNADTPKIIANPGSALGEAVGALMETEIHRLLEPIAKAAGCIYISTGPQNPKTGRYKKLLLKDNAGISYEIDAVIINNQFQPLVLLESKYIRYKKHNRDKVSWVCTAHTRLRRRYVSVRKSIAVLMGNWSSTSKQLLRSHEVEIFEISFGVISAALAKYGVTFNWAEKDRAQAVKSWERFNQLSDNEKADLIKEALAAVESDLRQAIEEALDESAPQDVKSVAVVVYSTWGETFTYHFNTLEEAAKFLADFDKDVELDTTNADSLLESLGGNQLSLG